MGQEAEDEGFAPLAWNDRIPPNPDARRVGFDRLRKAEADQKADIEDVKEGYDLKGKRQLLTEANGWMKDLIKIDAIFAKLDEEQRTRLWKQLQLRASDAKWDSAPGLFDDLIAEANAGSGTSDETPVFDKTNAAEKVVPIRQGRAPKDPNPPVPPRDTGSLSPEDAEAAFKAANEASAKKRTARAKNKGEAPAGSKPEGDDQEEGDIRPRFMRENEATKERPESVGLPTYTVN